MAGQGEWTSIKHLPTPALQMSSRSMLRSAGDQITIAALHKMIQGGWSFPTQPGPFRAGAIPAAQPHAPSGHSSPHHFFLCSPCCTDCPSARSIKHLMGFSDATLTLVLTDQSQGGLCMWARVHPDESSRLLLGGAATAAAAAVPGLVPPVNGSCAAPAAAAAAGCAGA